MTNINRSFFLIIGFQFCISRFKSKVLNLTSIASVLQKLGSGSLKCSSAPTNQISLWVFISEILSQVFYSKSASLPKRGEMSVTSAKIFHTIHSYSYSLKKVTIYVITSYHLTISTLRGHLHHRQCHRHHHHHHHPDNGGSEGPDGSGATFVADLEIHQPYESLKMSLFIKCHFHRYISFHI